MHRTRALRFLVPLVATLLVGCGKSPTSSAPGASTAVDVRLGFFPNLTHAQAVLGIASGDFEKAVAPGTFTARPFNAGPSLIEALFNHQIDIGYVGPGPVISAWARSHGEAIRVVSGAAGSGVIIVARPGSNIHSMADLAGKRIATPQKGNTQDISARHYMTAVLHASDTNNVLPIANADQAGMMSRGDIDAAWDPEPWGTLLMKTTGATLVGQEKDLWPTKDFSLTVVVTSPEFLAAHPDVVAAVLKVNHDWTVKLAANPGQYADELDAELAKLTGKKNPRRRDGRGAAAHSLLRCGGARHVRVERAVGDRFGIQPNDAGSDGARGYVGDGEKMRLPFAFGSTRVSGLMTETPGRAGG